MTTEAHTHALARVFDQATQNPEAAALHSTGRQSLSYQQLQLLVYLHVGRINSLGVTRNDRVAVVCPNGPEMAVACLSVTAGATCVPLNPTSTAEEFRFFLKTLNVKLLLVAANLDCPVREVANQLAIPQLEIHFEGTVYAGVFKLVHAASGSTVPPTSRPVYARVDDTAFVLHTSGSTAEPKLVPISHRNIIASVNNIVASLELSNRDCCLNMMPMFHIGALVDLLIAPLSVGGSVVMSTSMSATRFFDCLDEFAPSWYQGVPTMLQDIIERGRMGALSPPTCLRFVRAVSSALTARLETEVESLLSAPVIAIYGMTETCGQISSNPLPPAERKSTSVGFARGSELKIIDSAGNPAAAGKIGEIIVRGDNVIAAYESDASKEHNSINEAAFFNGWLRTGDLGYCDGDNYLFLTGRIKEIINRGGEKISPAEVDLVLLSHPAVVEAAAFAVEHPTLGEEVAAAVVLSECGEINEEDIMDFAASQLSYLKVPRKVFLLDQLPRSSGGKLQRHLLVEQFKDRDNKNFPAALVVPTSTLATKIAAMWKRALDISVIGMHDNFFDLGGDSLSAASFMLDIEVAMNIALPASVLFDAPTLEEFEQHLLKLNLIPKDSTLSNGPEKDALPRNIFRALIGRSAAWMGQRANDDSLLVGHNTLGSEQPVYWCADSSKWLTGLSASLGADQPVYAMRNLWGMQEHNREQYLVDALAQHFVDEMTGLQPHGPYIIGGFCEGGKIAVAVARLLKQRGQHTTLLCLVEHYLNQSFSGQVAYYFTEDSRFSPYRSFERPELGWKKLFAGETTISLYPWAHNEFVEKEKITLIAQQLKQDIGNARDGGTPAIKSQTPPCLDDDDYRSHLQLRAPILVKPGKTFGARLTIKNLSDATWQASPDSGISVYSRWLDPLGNVITARSGELGAPVPPGSSVNLNLVLTAPERSDRWILELGLVEEGIRWFSDKGTGETKKALYIYRPRDLWQRVANTVFHR